MSKPRLRQTRAKNSDPTYSTRLPKEKQAERNRVAVKAYYRRNIDSIREKRRIAMADKKAAKQLRRRQWDPPKKAASSPTLTVHSDNRSDLSARTNASYVPPPWPVDRFKDIRDMSSDGSLNRRPRDPNPASEAEAAWGTTISHHSHTSAESAAATLLAPNNSQIRNVQTLDGHISPEHIPLPVIESDIVDEAGDSLVGLDILRGSQRGVGIGPQAIVSNPGRSREFTWNKGGGQYLIPGSLPPGSAPLTLMQQIHLERTGCVGQLSRVQVEQISVFRNNSGPLTRPSIDDEKLWMPERTRIWDSFGPGVGMLDEGQRLTTLQTKSIHLWILGIEGAHRRFGGWDFAQRAP
ncbi:hypothetical protein C8J57DRAFT_1511653 [Mycena rebaudengoi]|nr:hypothetical protein C8J57DRAFT_1511653 [Mycena rebaudengoi]